MVRHATIGTLALVLTLAAASAQDDGDRGRRSDRWFRSIDQNENGSIDPEEWERNPPLRDWLLERGVPLNREMGLEEFGNATEAFGNDMRARGGFGGGGPRRDGGGDSNDDGPRGRFGGGDRGSFRFSFGPGGGPPGGGPPGGAAEVVVQGGVETPAAPPAEEGRGGRRGGRRGERGGDRGPRSNDAPAAAPAGKEPPKPGVAAKKGAKPAQPRPKVTLPLPESYAAKDLNRDGQIGLYEWARDDLAAFALLDRNQDGFLTPAELAAKTPAASSTVTVAVVSPSVAPPVAPAAVAPPAAAPAAPPDALLQRGKFVFAQLDQNRDGQVNPDEWSRSRTVKPLFEKAGIDITQAMPEATFLDHYKRVAAN